MPTSQCATKSSLVPCLGGGACASPLFFIAGDREAKTGHAGGELFIKIWKALSGANWRRAAVELCRVHFLICTVALCSVIALGIPVPIQSSESAPSTPDHTAPFSQVDLDREDDKVSGWVEVSTGYGLEELRRYSEGENPSLRETFEATDSLYWSMAGMLEMARKLDENDTLELAAQVRSTRYAISQRRSRDEVNLDLTVGHSFQESGSNLIAGLRLEEVVSSSRRSRTKMIFYGVSNMPLDQMSSLQTRVGLRRIEDHEDAISGHATELRAKVSRKFGKAFNFNVRARHYREHWPASEQSFRMNSGGASLAYTPQGQFGVRLSGFVTDRVYGVPDARTLRVRDDQWGANLNLDYDPAPDLSVEAETSFKKRTSNHFERDRNDRLISLSLRYRI